METHWIVLVFKTRQEPYKDLLTAVG